MKIIKKIAKIWAILFIFNVICGIGFFGYYFFSVFRPAIKGADVSLIDLIKSDLTHEQEVKLDNLLKENGHRIGSNAADKVKGVLLKLVPPVKYDSETKNTDNKYPTPSEVVDINNEKTKDSLKKGLEIINQMDKENEAVRKKSLQ